MRYLVHSLILFLIFITMGCRGSVRRSVESKPELVIQNIRNFASHLVVAPDGKSAALGYRVYDLQSGMLLYDFSDSPIKMMVCRDLKCADKSERKFRVDDPYYTGVFSPDSRYFAMVGSEWYYPGSVPAVWDLDSGAYVSRLWQAADKRGPYTAKGIPFTAEEICQWTGARSLVKKGGSSSSMRLSPDGKLGIFEKREGAATRLIVQRISDGKEIWARDFIYGWFGVPVFSFDNHYLVYQFEGSAIVEDLQTGREVFRVRQNRSADQVALFSRPTQRWLCIRKAHSELILLNPPDWKIVREIKLHTTEEYQDSEIDIVFGPDEKWLLDEHGFRYDLSTGQSRRVFQTASVTPINSLALSPQSDVLAIATYVDGNYSYGKGAAIAWKLTDERGIVRLLTKQPAYVAAFTPEGNVIVGTEVRDSDGVGHELHVGRISLMDLNAGKLIRTYDGPSLLDDERFGASKALAVSGDGKYLAAGKLDMLAFQECEEGSPCGYSDIEYIGLLHVWDLKTGSIQLNKRIEEGIIEGIAASPDGRSVAVASNNKLSIWDVPGSRRRWNLTFESYNGAVLDSFNPRVIRPVVFSPDGRRLALANTLGAFSIWQFPQKTPQYTHPLIENEFDAWISAMVYSADGKLLFTGNCSGKLRVYNTSDWKQMNETSAHKRCISDIVISGNGAWMATASLDGVVKIWKLPDLQELATLLVDPYDGEWLVIAPDGRYDASNRGGQLAGWRHGRWIEPINKDLSKRKPGLLFEIMRR